MTKNRTHAGVPSLVLVAVAWSLLPTLTAGAASATILVSPPFGPPTSVVKVSGRGFGSAEIVDLTFDSAPLAKATTKPNGAFAKRIRVPATAVPGGHTIRASGESSGSSASATFTVRTDWARYRFDAVDTGHNPYENVLSPSNVGSLTTKWTFQAPGYTAPPPAIVDGVVYVGVGPVGLNNTYLYANDATSGAVLWRAKQANAGFPSGPTVASGTIYLGTLDDHALRAYDAASGTLLWTFQAVGAVGSPVVANRTLYVGVNTGIVYALDPKTGAKLWEAQTAGPTFPRSVAVAGGLVYLGSDDNNLYAFDARTGAVAWKAATGGDILSSAAVANGIVYVGSDDHNLYAFDAATGVTKWTAPTGGVIETSPAVADGTVYVNSADGTLRAFDAASGSVMWTFATGGSLIASPVVAGGVVFVGGASDGNVEYAIDAKTGLALWTYATGGLVSESPAVVDGVLYFGSHDDTFYAFALPT